MKTMLKQQWQAETMEKAYNSSNLDFSVGEVVRQICHMKSGGWGTQVFGQLRGHLVRRYDI